MNLIVLDSTSKVLQVVLAAAHATTALDLQATWRDVTATTYVGGESSDVSNGSTPVPLVAAPAASTQRFIDYIAIFNADTISHTVSVRTLTVATPRVHIRTTLRSGESLYFVDGGWQVLNARAARLVEMAAATPAPAVAVPFYKIGTAAEVAGAWYCWSKDTGMPGAWAPGTPGVSGRATDGTASADNGCLRVLNAPSGQINLLTGVDGAASVAGNIKMCDVLWVNTAVSPTTTTPQTINSVAWPARDLDGSTNGRGVLVGILVTSATTNAGAVTNTTMSYTNSDGVAGRTATMASFPATAVAGTVVWFELAAGDQGIRSIQSITLGTSYGGGSISLIAATWLMGRGDPFINTGPVRQAPNQDHGVRLYDGACILPFGVASATTARTIEGNMYVATRAA
jgi:hypothetical protein